MKKSNAIFLVVAAVLLVSCTNSNGGSSGSASRQAPSQPISAPAPSSTSPPSSSLPPPSAVPYEVRPITAQRYENGDSYIEFNDLPENDAETVVCNSYLLQMTGELQQESALWMYLPQELVPDEEDEANYEVVHEWVKINNVQELSLEEVKQREEYPELFGHWHNVVESQLSYDQYAEAVFASGCRMVLVDYENKYFDYIYERGPQLSDGKHSILWLLGPEDADGNLRIFQNTQFFWSLFLSRDKSEWPSFVVH